MEYYDICGINKFVERDVDMLLAEELRVNAAFGKWAARAMPSKRRGRRSTGRSRPSRSIESSIASTAKTSLPRRRLGAERGREIELFGHVADVWVTQRNKWQGSRAAAN